MDLTGKLPVTSKSGNKYLFFIYNCDSNNISVQPMKARTDKEFLRAFNDQHNHPTTRGIKPDYMQLENEASLDFQQEICSKDIYYQIPPPGIQRQNPDEHAIITFKYHFTTGICSTDSYFPMQNWDKLLEQVGIPLILMRTSRLNPKMSAYTYINGYFE